jgi:hypothetical protein
LPNSAFPHEPTPALELQTWRLWNAQTAYLAAPNPVGSDWADGFVTTKKLGDDTNIRCFFWQSYLLMVSTQ